MDTLFKKNDLIIVYDHKGGQAATQLKGKDPEIEAQMLIQRLIKSGRFDS